jgi:Na+/melibiose symporter-like transporter
MNTLSKSSRFSYGIGQTAFSAKDTCFQFFLFFYYTQILGLSASLAGLAALLALVADGISDPIVGQISDNFKKNKWGRRHPFMIAAVLPFTASLVAIFNPPAGLSEMQLFSWFLVMAITVRTFLTLFSVPHMALGAEITTDYTERTSISVARTVAGYTGAIFIQVCAWFYLIPVATAAGDMGQGYQNVGWVAAGLALVGMTISIMGTRSRIPFLPETGANQQSRRWYYAFVDIVGLLKRPAARVLLMGNLVMVVAMGIGNTMVIHVNTYFYGFSSEQIGVFMLCVLFSLIPAALLAVKGAHYLGKRHAIVKIIIMVAVVGPIPVVLKMYGFMPAKGSMMMLLVVGVFVFLQQSFYIAQMTISASMLPDIADEIEDETGKRQEGMLNSAIMLTQKITFGVGAFIAGMVIDFAGFESGVTDMVVTQEMMLRLGWVYGPGIGALVLLAAFIYNRYPLSKERYVEIRQSLDKKHNEKLVFDKV